MKTHEEKVTLVKAQIKTTVDAYMSGLPDKLTPRDMAAALMSGICLTAIFLAANDGSTVVTPQVTLDAVRQLAKEWGLNEENLS